MISAKVPNQLWCSLLAQCHKAKNFTPGKEAASTKVATAVQEVQNLLPRARVVYCSATGVSEVGNMAFMTRLVGAHIQCFKILYPLYDPHGRYHDASIPPATKHGGCIIDARFLHWCTRLANC